MTFLKLKFYFTFELINIQVEIFWMFFSCEELCRNIFRENVSMHLAVKFTKFMHLENNWRFNWIDKHPLVSLIYGSVCTIITYNVITENQNQCSQISFVPKLATLRLFCIFEGKWAKFWLNEPDHGSINFFSALIIRFVFHLLVREKQKSQFKSI